MNMYHHLSLLLYTQPTPISFFGPLSCRLFFNAEVFVYSPLTIPILKDIFQSLPLYCRKHAKLHFACQGRTGEHCLYKTTLYTMKTRNPRTWIHLMFLALQVGLLAGLKKVLGLFKFQLLRSYSLTRH